jgi:hypothetical protein
MKNALCTFVLVLTIGGAARAGDMQIHLQASGGGLLTSGLSDFTHSGAGGFSVGFIWPVSDYVRLGLRQTLNFSVMPYGDDDGEPSPGMRSDNDYFEKDLTILPSTSFLLKIDPTERLSLDLSLGVGLVASSELGIRSLIPYPAAGAGVELVMARYNGSSLRLRAQCDAVFMAFYRPQPVLFIPQVGLLYVF